MIAASVICAPVGVLCAETPKRASAQAIAEIRDRIRRQQAVREEVQERQALVPWHQLAESPDPAVGKKMVLVRLSNTMNFFRAVWTFNLGEENTAQPVRVLLCWRGEQWIALPPGNWQVTLAVGREDGAQSFRFPIAPLSGRRGEVYELTLTGQTEQSILALERAEARKAAEVRQRLQKPKEETQNNPSPAITKENTH